MALSQDIIAELISRLETGEDVTADEVTDVINSNLPEGRYILESTLNSEEIPNSFFKKFRGDDIAEHRRQIVTESAWSTGSRLGVSDMHTHVDQADNSESGDYFFEVYDKNSNNDAARAQFFTAFGHRSGLGSERINPADNASQQAKESTKAIYDQHRVTLMTRAQLSELDPDGSALGPKFFNTEGASIGSIDVDGDDHFYTINISRSRYKEKFDPGNWELRLLFPGSNWSESSYEANVGSDNPSYDTDVTASSYSVVKLVDEAVKSDFNNEQLETGTTGGKYRVLSGSLNSDVASSSSPDVIKPGEFRDSFTTVINGAQDAPEMPEEPYGYFFPNVGIIILDPKMLSWHARDVIGTGPERVYDESSDSFSYVDNSGSNLVNRRTNLNEDQSEIDERVSHIAPYNLSEDSEDKTHRKFTNCVKWGGYFVGRSAEEVVSSHYFVRVTNRDFNYSNNPTFVDHSDGTLKVKEFNKDPKTYITTVGLYDEQNTLVAVAKTSKPIEKDFQSEALIKIQLSF